MTFLRQTWFPKIFYDVYINNSILNSFRIIQRDPTSAGFQLTPAGGSLPGGFLHNGKDAFSRILPGLSVIRPRTFPDVQVCDGYLHQIRGKSVS